MRALPLLLLSLSSAALCGCGAGSSITTTTTPALSGHALGGNQLLGNSTIQLWEAGTTYSGAATALISGGVTADSSGAFSITGGYTCPTPQTQVYLSATGGNPGLGGTLTPSPNPNIALLAALGSCGNLSSSTHIVINEVTTVAAAYALAGFSSDYSHIGAPASNATGLDNAFLVSGVLASSDTGQSVGTGPTGSVVPTAAIYTLANALASCVNSTGGSAGDSTPCGALFTAATPTAGSAPTNTADAAINIAHHPATNAAAIYSLVTSSGPFQPTLTATPNDWTLSVSYPLPAVATDLATDSAGNTWLVNATALYEMSPTGSITSTNTAMSGSKIALGPDGAIWSGATTLKQLPAGAGAPTVYAGAGFTGTAGLAVDDAGNAWYAVGSSTSLYETSVTGATFGPYTTVDSHQSSVAIDPSDNIWVGNVGGSGKVSELLSLGIPTSGAPWTLETGASSNALAIDGAGNTWIAGGSAAYRVTSFGSVTNFPAYISGGSYGLSAAQGVTIDGAGSAWFVNNLAISNATAGSVAGFSNSGTGITPYLGYVSSTLAAPYGIDADISGNLWLRNTSAATVTLMVGAATPVVRPLALGLRNGTLGTRP
ncbi:MAG: hypothetical protein PW792_15200 [Acidobacteriaceae bacterium]|nr:hypothetical protein [Acidobacteriaceae bacterium]